jgi:hypothetical protein
MSTKIRKQIYLEAEQDAALKRLSEDNGISEAEFIRQAIDQRIQEIERRKRAMAAWEEEKAFIKERMKLGPVPRKRTWKREDLYDRGQPYDR